MYCVYLILHKYILRENNAENVDVHVLHKYIIHIKVVYIGHLSIFMWIEVHCYVNPFTGLKIANCTGSTNG